MKEPIICPGCGEPDNSPSSTCPNCGYTYRYEDLMDQDIDRFAFVKELRCTNCGKIILKKFSQGDNVYYERKTIFKGETVRIDRVHGERVQGTIDGKDFQFICPNCELEHRLLIVDERPIEPRSAGC